jgi:hypothetical protein
MSDHTFNYFRNKHFSDASEYHHKHVEDLLRSLHRHTSGLNKLETLEKIDKHLDHPIWEKNEPVYQYFAKGLERRKAIVSQHKNNRRVEKILSPAQIADPATMSLMLYFQSKSDNPNYFMGIVPLISFA